MGLTVDVLGRDLRPKGSVTQREMTELVHNETAGTLAAEWAGGCHVETGDMIDLICVDGRHRLFEVTAVDRLDDEGTVQIQAMDAAKQELKSTVVVSASISGVQARTAVERVLNGKGWTLGTVSASGTVGEVQNPDYEDAERALQKIADTAEVEIVPYFEITAEGITKNIDIIPQEPVYRGRIISGGNAREIVLTQEGSPMTRVYAIGKTTGLGEERSRTTISGVAWKKANGKPVDKPAGQPYIEAPGTEGKPVREYVYSDPYEGDAGKLAEAAYKDLLKKAEGEKSGTAKAADIGMVNGYQTDQVRVNDLVGIRSRYGQVQQERIAEIKRDYLRPQETLLEYGKRQSADWITHKVEQIQQTIRGGRGGGGGMTAMEAEIDEAYIELYQAVEQIVYVEEQAEVQFNQVWIDLDAVHGRLELAATTGDLETLEHEVWIELNALDDRITLKADRIELQGYVTASQLSAEIASINKFFSAQATAAQMNVGILNAQTSFSIGGKAVGSTYKTMVTEVIFPTLKTQGITYMGADGISHTVNVVTGFSNRGSTTTSNNYWLYRVP